MDYFDRDMQHVKVSIGKQLNLANISGGYDLDKVEKLASRYHHAVLFSYPDTPEPFFVSGFFKWLGKKPGTSEYVAADYYSALKKGGNITTHMQFIQHFNTPGAGQHRAMYKFIDINNKELWLIACSTLIDCGKNSLPFILTLLFNPESPGNANGRILDDICEGFDLDEVCKVVEEFTEREREVFELVGYGCKNKAGSDKLFIAPATFETHKKRLRKKLGVYTEAEISRIFFFHKHGRRQPLK